MITLLVPLDTSDISAKVVVHAETLAKQLNARVVLLHVIEPVAAYVPVGASMDLVATPPPLLEVNQVAAAKANLEKLAGAFNRAGVEVSCEALLGMPVDEIISYAAAQKADYIVLGSHGHGALFHLLSGNVVTGVLKRSPCPVVVVPAGRKKS